MKNLWKVSALVFGTAILAGSFTACCCKDVCPVSAKAVDGKKIFNEKWELEDGTLAGSGKNWEKPDQDITFRIAPNGKVSGCSGVNLYFGSAKVNADAKTLKFGVLGSTRRAGKGMEMEGAYLKMLQKVDSYEIIDWRLLFKTGKDVVAAFD